MSGSHDASNSHVQNKENMLETTDPSNTSDNVVKGEEY